MEGEKREWTREEALDILEQCDDLRATIERLEARAYACLDVPILSLIDCENLH